MIFNICSRLRAIVLGILTIFKKALCCFSRRRKRSNSECEVLNMVSVIQNDSNASQSSTGSRNRGDDIRDWNSWDDSPRTVTEHIEQYRQKIAQPNRADEETTVDFFQDMAPKIIKQKKLLIKTENSAAATPNFSRLQATTAATLPIVQTADLEDWNEDDDGNNKGWDELDDENTKHLIRESRREMRAQRQQQLLKQKLTQQQQGFAERVSTIRQS